jgi:glycosyltransferase involved in cell wall biosynthesis
LLDAMGAGLCVLTSDVPENREVVDGAGYTFKRGDSDDLAERLRFLISNPAVREAAGNAARRRIEEQYQWQKIATDIEKAYLQILGRSEQKLPARKQSVRAVPSTQSRDKDRRAG